jgi:hypothetical protein
MKTAKSSSLPEKHSPINLELTMTNNVLETTYVIRKTAPNGVIHCAGPDNVMSEPDWLEENEHNPIYLFSSVEEAKRWAERNSTRYIDFIGIRIPDENIRIENILAMEGVDYDNYPRIQVSEYVPFDTDDDTNVLVPFFLEKLKEVKNKHRKSLHYKLEDSDIQFTLEYYEYNCATLCFSFDRYETDDEYRDRVKRQIAYENKKANDRANSKKSKEEKERAQYERLKKKFEGKE